MKVSISRTPLLHALAEGNRRYATLAVGDLVAFLVFGVLGLASHDLATTPASLFRTVAPFAVAWFALGPLLGAFRASTTSRPTQAWWRVLVIWLVCGAVGLLLRSWWLDRPFILTFAVVTVGVNMALLVGWRTGFALVARRVRGVGYGRGGRRVGSA